MFEFWNMSLEVLHFLTKISASSSEELSSYFVSNIDRIKYVLFPLKS